VSHTLIDDDRRSWSIVAVDGEVFARLPVRTRWLGADDDLATVLKNCLPPLLLGDTVVVSEKVAVLLTGRSVPLANVRVGATSRLLARFVRPRSGSRGLSVPAKMQYVLDEVGWFRLVLAACASALTRPVGLPGVFYRVAGPVARDLDGARPPYEHRLLPPLPPTEAASLCARLEQDLGTGVAVIDINDFGGSIRARSPRALRASQLRRAVSDNPLGQRLRGTPFAVVRPGRRRGVVG
jgi:F420-0:gamma-glutamyl ligase